MDNDQILQYSRWELVEALGAAPASATELAKRTGLSLPNISQQLRLLEAYGYVVHDKHHRRTGKPTHLYRLRRELLHVAYARKGFAARRTLNPDTYHQMISNTLFVPKQDDVPFLHRFLLSPLIWEGCSVAYLKSTTADVEVFILTDRIEEVRKHHSHTPIEHDGKTRKVVAWTHSLAEVNEGLSRDEPYFHNLARNHLVLHDPEGRFDALLPP